MIFLFLFFLDSIPAFIYKMIFQNLFRFSLFFSSSNISNKFCNGFEFFFNNLFQFSGLYQQIKLMTCFVWLKHFFFKILFLFYNGQYDAISMRILIKKKKKIKKLKKNMFAVKKSSLIFDIKCCVSRRINLGFIFNLLYCSTESEKKIIKLQEKFVKN